MTSECVSAPPCWCCRCAIRCRWRRNWRRCRTCREGRLILGAGVGWLEAEFAALGVPFPNVAGGWMKASRMMKAVWSQDPVTFRGDLYPGKDPGHAGPPLPVAPIPIWIGGSSEPAIRRALRLAMVGTAP